MGVADEVRLLGGFTVTVDGRTVDPAHWRRRPAAALVKLLALAPDRRLHREQVIDALWPDATVADAAPRLHKAVHFARRALGPDAIGSVGDTLQLLPGRTVDVDVVAFESAAAAALERGADVEAALAWFGGELLNEDRYQPWADVRRDHVDHLHRQLLRSAGRWTELLAEDPADEPAHVALMRGHVQRGDRAAALAQYDRLAAVLADELGVEPGDDARQVRDTALGLQAGDAAPSATELPAQDVRFCVADDGVRLAYAVVGEGRPLVKAANWLNHLDYDWDSATWRHWLLELTARFRLLRYDERGCGLSDWNTTEFTLEAWIEDLATVVDAAAYERFPLLGVSQGAAVAVEYASRHPERVSALVLYGGFAVDRSSGPRPTTSSGWPGCCPTSPNSDGAATSRRSASCSRPGSCRAAPRSSGTSSTSSSDARPRRRTPPDSCAASARSTSPKRPGG